MNFPLSLWDISLWLAVTAIILLATYELLSPYYGKTVIFIEKNRLRTATLIVTTFFFFTVLIRIITSL